MQGVEKQDQIVRIKDKWYVETRTGYAGPFDRRSEAKKHLLLMKDANTAQLPFAGLSLSSQ